MRTAIRPMLLALTLVPHSAALAGSPGGIGILGDSYSDEYQFYPPDRSTARNWVEILAVTRGFDFGPFTKTGRGEPRNEGYAFNWARSDATTDDLIATGQHTGLAAQVARGEVGLVVVFIGGNDFINALKASDPVGRLGEMLPRALRNHRIAVETILAADTRVRVVLVTLPDIRHLPEFAGLIRTGKIAASVADAFTCAMRRYNGQIRSLAIGNPRLAIVDLDLATRAANLVSTEYTLVGGLRLDRLNPGNGLDRFFLADVRHPGTLGHGLMARMFIEVMNARFGAGIAPLQAREVLDLARSVSPRGDPPAVVRLAGNRPRAAQATRAVRIPRTR
ncbi:MAG: SGNH/GDSL hydrolase family protein [Isosphaeraceae bacterium]